MSTTSAVTGTDSTQSSGATSSSTSNASSSSLLNMDSFLKMFTTELQYQDPTNPMQSYELAAQLAQYSTVEQLSKLNTAVSAQSSLLSSINNAQMVNLIGHQVQASSAAIQVDKGSATSASYTLDSSASDVSIGVYDQDNKLVRTIKKGQQNAGSYSLDWDGKDDSGSSVQDGMYTFKVQATDDQGNSLDVSTLIAGTVSALHMDGTNSYLVLDNGQEVSINAVTKILDASTSTNGDNTTSS